MAYTYNELAARLAALQVGGTELLSAVQFDATFGPDGTLEARKFAAMHFAEKHACRVVFIGRAEVFCQFTRLSKRRKCDFNPP